MSGPSNQPKISLILGGARSGKSALAERLAQARAEAGVLYAATLLPYDTEMRARVIRHRASRPATWRTVETPYKLAEGVLSTLQNEKIVLVDCLTVWTANLLMRASGMEHLHTGEVAEEAEPPQNNPAIEPEPDYVGLEAGIIAELESLVLSLRQRETGLLLVSNEVGMGLVPPYPMGRAYRDLLGRVNQRMAQLSDEAFMVFAGIPLELKRLQAELGL